MSSKQIQRKLILGEMSREHQPRFCAVYSTPSKVISWQQSVPPYSNLNSAHSIYLAPLFLTVIMKNWIKSTNYWSIFKHPSY